MHSLRHVNSDVSPVRQAVQVPPGPGCPFGLHVDPDKNVARIPNIAKLVARRTAGKYPIDLEGDECMTILRRVARRVGSQTSEDRLLRNGQQRTKGRFASIWRMSSASVAGSATAR